MARPIPSTTSAEPIHGHGAGVDRLAPCRLFGEARDVHVAVDGEGEGARDGGRRHHQHMGMAVRLCLHREPLMHAEAVLLVDHHQRQVAKADVRLEQRMGADENVDVA